MFGVKLFIDQVSFMEIYNEVVNDLLSDPKTRPIGGLKVKAGEGGVVFVDGMEAHVVNTKEEIFALMKKGEESRHTGKTKMNERSSRSHTIFRLSSYFSFNPIPCTHAHLDQDYFGEHRQK